MIMKEIIKEKIVTIIFVFLIIAAMITGLIFYGLYVNPDKIVIKNYTISNTNIPTDFDDVSIAYVSDINYGEFSDLDDYKKLIDKINKTHADVVLFGGDLFHDSKKALNDPKIKNEIQKGLNDIKAPLGKFYVLGDQDKDDETAINNMFYNANFENLTNANTKLYNHTNNGINLVGIDTLVKGKADFQDAFKDVDSKQFTVVFTHTPDIANNLKPKDFDLLLGGHSHGKQINLPFININKVKKGATDYQSGIHHKENSEICVSNGVSTTETDVRLFSNNEIIVYTLHHKK